MKQTLALFLIGCLMAPASVEAQQKKLTWIGHEYERCLKKSGRTILAWVPGFTTYCLWNASQGQQGIALAISRCNERLSRQQRRIIRCKVAYDGKRIIDPLLTTAAAKYQPVPVQITVFDRRSGKKQRMKGTLTQKVHRYGRTIPVELAAEGIGLCQGTIRVGARGIKYDWLCFKARKYSGSLDITELRPKKIGKLWQAVPDVTRLESRGSYIEVRY